MQDIITDGYMESGMGGKLGYSSNARLTGTQEGELYIQDLK